MWQLIELITGLPGLLAYAFLEEGETGILIFSSKREFAVFKVRGFHFLSCLFLILFFQYVPLLH